MATAIQTTSATVIQSVKEVTDGGEGDAATSEKVIKRIELPEDVVSEIFSWLPAKSIFKFKSCSKSILEFTKETNFSLKQSQNLMLQDDTSFFIQGIYGSNNSNYKTEIHALPGNEASSGIPTNFLQFLNERSVRILHSRNGLLLCEIASQGNPKVELFICNPATQSCSSIATPCMKENPNNSVVFVFECNHNKDVHSEEYQLLLFELHNQGQGSDQYFVCKTYKPKEGVWEEREKSFFMDHKGMICSPSFRGSYRYALSYNFESGKTRRIYFPREVEEIELMNLPWSYGFHIFKWGTDKIIKESICLVVLVKRIGFTLWVLTNYESNSWSKFLTLSLEEMGLVKNSILGFTVINGDSLVFATKHNVYRYDLIREGERRLEKIGEHKFDGSLCFVSYSNTLRSCGVDAKDLSCLR